MAEARRRTINIDLLFKMGDAVRRGFVNQFAGMAGTYRFAEIFGARTPEEVRNFWAEVEATIKKADPVTIRTVQYDPDDLATSPAPDPLSGLTASQREEVEAIADAMRAGAPGAQLARPASDLSVEEMEKVKKVIDDLRHARSTVARRPEAGKEEEREPGEDSSPEDAARKED